MIGNLHAELKIFCAILMVTCALMGSVIYYLSAGLFDGLSGDGSSYCQECSLYCTEIYQEAFEDLDNGDTSTQQEE